MDLERKYKYLGFGLNVKLIKKNYKSIFQNKKYLKNYNYQKIINISI